MEVKKSWDIAAIAVLSFILALLVYIIPDEPAHLVLGLPFILFFPGYALISLLFPEKKSLELIERLALSFGLSIAIVPLIGFGLYFAPLGISIAPILWSIIVFTVIFSVAALWRRSNSNEPFLPFELGSINGKISKQLSGQSKVDKTLSVLLVIAIISTIVAIGYVVAFPREGEPFTEFYILGPGGEASSYPKNLTIDQNASVIVGIANHEGRTINYSVEVWLENATYINNITSVHHLYYLDSFNTTLNNVPVNLEDNWTKQWHQTYNFTIPYPGHYKLWFILLKDGRPFSGQYLHDYVGTDTQTRFIDMVTSNNYLTLNLNLKVSA